jgi:localization factor PodJL
MKSAIPWSIKGIESNAREQAKEAARKQGLTLGEWLNTVITEKAEAGESDHMPARAIRKPIAQVTQLDRATSKLETIAEQLARLAERSLQPPAGGYSVYQPQERSDDGEQFKRILTRIESNERQSIDAFSAVNERLGTLGKQFAQAAKAATTFKPEEHPSFQALDKAVRNIVDHLENSEKRTRDNFKLMQDRMADMASRAQSAPSDHIIRQAPVFSQLERRLSELVQRVDVAEKVPQQNNAELLRGELKELAKRIDQVRDTAETLASRAQTQAVQTSQQELRQIEQRILGLLNETQQTFARGSVSDQDLQHIRSDIDALNKKIDQTRQSATGERDVQQLRSAVEQLSNRVAQGPDMRPIADLDRRIIELAQKISEQQAAPPQAVQDLEQRMYELDQKLDYAINSFSQSQKPDTGLSDQLSQQLAAVGDRLDRAEAQLSHLGTIERAISQLYDGLEQVRSTTSTVAEEAANRAAERVMNQMPAQLASGPAPSIQHLEDGLQSVREAGEASDQRNQETLLALHETLEHIVGKLTELETATIGRRIAQAAMDELPPGHQSQTASITPHQSPSMPDFASATQVATAQVHELQQAQREQVVFHGDSIPSSAYDLGPAMDVRNIEPSADPSPTVESAGTQEASAGTEGATAQPEVPVDDFIAAARRAHQAAQGVNGRLGVPGNATRPKKSESNSLFAKLAGAFKGGNKSARTAAEELRPRPQAVGLEAPVASNQKFRKFLLFAGLGLAALALLMSYSKLGTVLKSPVPAKVSSFIEKVIPGSLLPGSLAAPEPAKSDVEPLVVDQAAASAETSNGMPAADEILTGSVTAPKLTPTGANVAAIVAGKAADPGDLPPTQIGSEQLRNDAATGDTAAQFIVASRFMDGERIQRNFEQAAVWYEKAANAGLAPAQYRIATLYERGRGVNRSLPTALEWYRKAAALGNVRSMHNAAVLLAGTELGKPDYTEAKKWFSLAASHGLKDSQYNLAVLFERGYVGGKPELDEALFWFLAAAQQNDAEAKKRADALVDAMPAKSVKAAKAKLQAWKPESAPENANAVQITNPAWQDQPSTAAEAG